MLLVLRSLRTAGSESTSHTGAASNVLTLTVMVLRNTTADQGGPKFMTPWLMAQDTALS